MVPELIDTKYGYKEVKDKPSPEELQAYYTEKYYGTDRKFNKYQKEYGQAERTFLQNRLKRKCQILERMAGMELKGKRALDIGCGEGWALDFFLNMGMEVKGLEFSLNAVNEINPQVAKCVQEGDVFKNLDKLLASKEKYDVILMDNVLEHVLDPEYFVLELKNILTPSGVLIVEVPNDFSKLQSYLMNENKIDREFWIAYPDHLSYFNYKGLKNIFVENGWNALDISCDFPIDMHLLNENTNYVQDKSKGKSVHFARVEWENLLDEISVEKANQLFSIYAEMGLGRNLIGYFTVS